MSRYLIALPQYARFLALVLIAPLAAGCSGASEPATIHYTGDPVGDFVTAIEAGDAATVARLAGADPTLLELQDETGQTAMHYAALGNQPEVIRVLHEKGLDINVRDAEGRTPLTVLEDSGFKFEAVRETLIALGGQN